MSRMGDIATDLLATASAAFADSAAAPEVSYIADGAITMEIGPERETGPYSAIVVTWDAVRPGPAVGASVDLGMRDGVVTSGVFSIYVLRLAPVSDDDGVMSFDEIGAAALVMLDDAWRVQSAVVNAYASGDVGGVCGTATILSQVPVGPEGGVEGSRLQLAVSLL